ncbi:coiled-coil domain-containing protein 34-like [Physella acuta]|uniref:coiled-coil domain-containing protein 34-like n=1 Tax=Physella acuta TaxID=109671 RepID=UPI0027DB55AB|nr:coiled-coil domain-containing protein 34-like [Physella acuta]
MTGRPRPVTATVTKPKWMQLPSPDAMNKIRRKSLESNGSTASLTSLLEHSSFDSDSDVDRRNTHMSDSETLSSPKRVEVSNRKISSSRRSKTSNSNLSAWEQWIIEKAKEDFHKKQTELIESRLAKLKKEEKDREKHMKQVKVQQVRQSWIEKKNEEILMQKKLKKMKIKEEKEKEELKEKIKQKAAEKFEEWQALKRKEEKERRKRQKEDKERLQREEEQRKQKAEEKYQEWLQMAKNRPKSAPNSFGYLSGQIKGYHDRSAYPQPTFCNPIPWQPVAIPTQKADRTKKNKTKVYKWNPDKYY